MIKRDEREEGWDGLKRGRGRCRFRVIGHVPGVLRDQELGKRSTRGLVIATSSCFSSRFERRTDRVRSIDTAAHVRRNGDNYPSLLANEGRG